MESLLKLSCVSSMVDIKRIRMVYDMIESNVRSLQNLGMRAEMYGSLLIPIMTPNENNFLETRITFLIRKVVLIQRTLVLSRDVFLFQVKISCRKDKKIFVSEFHYLLLRKNILIFSLF